MSQDKNPHVGRWREAIPISGRCEDCGCATTSKAWYILKIYTETITYNAIYCKVCYDARMGSV